jgi:hypothetical protein
MDYLRRLVALLESMWRHGLILRLKSRLNCWKWFILSTFQCPSKMEKADQAFERFILQFLRDHRRNNERSSANNFKHEWDYLVWRFYRRQHLHGERWVNQEIASLSSGRSCAFTQINILSDRSMPAFEWCGIALWFTILFDGLYGFSNRQSVVGQHSNEYSQASRIK